MMAARTVFTLAATVALVLVSAVTGRDPRAASTPGPYVLTDLGIIGTIQSASASDINDGGDAVGTASGRAFVWRNGVISALPTISGGVGSTAAAINTDGQIAGSSRITSTGPTHAVLWVDGSPIDLTPDLPATQNSAASGVNDAGQAVGSIDYQTGFLWENGARIDLGHIGGNVTVPTDINNAAQVVGASNSTFRNALGPLQHPFLWQNNVITDLGVFDGDEDGAATAINAHGHIVGYSGRTDPEVYETTYRAFIYVDGVMSPLPVPSIDAYASDINDAGVIVGTMRIWGTPSRFTAWVYADGVATNLNSLIPSGSGLHLVFANGVNNAGQIVGQAIDSRGSYHAYLLTPAAPGTPVLNVGDASVVEGHTGTTAANFTVTLSAASSQPVTVSYSTSNGSATAGSDYQAASGTLTFAAGETSKVVSVPVMGDRAGEPNEGFGVSIQVVDGNAAIADWQGAGTIVDDEPRMTINSVSKNEGQSGTTQFVFTVTLSAASTSPVTVNYATADGSAKAAEDYDARSGSLTFNPGSTSGTVTVAVKGDRKSEPQEGFSVVLSGASGALVTGATGSGTIKNDDK